MGVSTCFMSLPLFPLSPQQHTHLSSPPTLHIHMPSPITSPMAHMLSPVTSPTPALINPHTSHISSPPTPPYLSLQQTPPQAWHRKCGSSAPWGSDVQHGSSQEGLWGTAVKKTNPTVRESTDIRLVLGSIQCVSILGSVLIGSSDYIQEDYILVTTPPPPLFLHSFSLFPSPQVYTKEGYSR